MGRDDELIAGAGCGDVEQGAFSLLNIVALGGEAVTLELPERWKAVLYTADIETIGRC